MFVCCCPQQLCVESIHGIEAALAGGADRIELCSALAVGGLTPSVGLMEHAVAMAHGCRPAHCPMAVMVMVRPRLGDFVYSVLEVGTMKADIRAARAAGVDGVVLGVSQPSGHIDEGPLRELVKEAKEGGRVRVGLHLLVGWGGERLFICACALPLCVGRLTLARSTHTHT